MAETVGAALIENGCVLLGLRAAHKSYAGRWDLIGGHVECGEPVWAALSRELTEELGIRIVRGDYITTLTLPDLSILHAYAVTSWQGDPVVQNDEHVEVRWFALDEAARLANLATSRYRELFASLSDRLLQSYGSQSLI